MQKLLSDINPSKVSLNLTGGEGLEIGRTLQQMARQELEFNKMTAETIGSVLSETHTMKEKAYSSILEQDLRELQTEFDIMVSKDPTYFTSGEEGYKRLEKDTKELHDNLDKAVNDADIEKFRKNDFLRANQTSMESIKMNHATRIGEMELSNRMRSLEMGIVGKQNAVKNSYEGMYSEEVSDAFKQTVDLVSEEIGMTGNPYVGIEKIVQTAQLSTTDFFDRLMREAQHVARTQGVNIETAMQKVKSNYREFFNDNGTFKETNGIPTIMREFYDEVDSKLADLTRTLPDDQRASLGIFMRESFQNAGFTMGRDISQKMTTVETSLQQDWRNSQTEMQEVNTTSIRIRESDTTGEFRASNDAWTSGNYQSMSKLIAGKESDNYGLIPWRNYTGMDGYTNIAGSFVPVGTQQGLSNSLTAWEQVKADTGSVIVFQNTPEYKDATRDMSYDEIKAFDYMLHHATGGNYNVTALYSDYASIHKNTMRIQNIFDATEGLEEVGINIPYSNIQNTKVGRMLEDKFEITTSGDYEEFIRVVGGYVQLKDENKSKFNMKNIQELTVDQLEALINDPSIGQLIAPDFGGVYTSTENIRPATINEASLKADVNARKGTQYFAENNIHLVPKSTELQMAVDQNRGADFNIVERELIEKGVNLDEPYMIGSKVTVRDYLKNGGTHKPSNMTPHKIVENKKKDGALEISGEVERNNIYLDGYEFMENQPDKDQVAVDSEEVTESQEDTQPTTDTTKDIPSPEKAIDEYHAGTIEMAYHVLGTYFGGMSIRDAIGTMEGILMAKSTEKVAEHGAVAIGSLVTVSTSNPILGIGVGIATRHGEDTAQRMLSDYHAKEFMSIDLVHNYGLSSKEANMVMNVWKDQVKREYEGVKLPFFKTHEMYEGKYPTSAESLLNVIGHIQENYNSNYSIEENTKRILQQSGLSHSKYVRSLEGTDKIDQLIQDWGLDAQSGDTLRRRLR